MPLEPDRIQSPDFHDDSSLTMALLGLAVGLMAGALILLFRLVVDGSLLWLLPEHSENFEGLSPLLRSALPLTAVGLLVMLFYPLPSEARRTGVVLVLERLHLQGGRLGLRDMGIQFVGAAVVLIGGLSMGREGPVVHLGASSGSLLGQWARRSEDDLRLLAGCGCAAAISATFNTPIAGVLFALEVLLLDYRITSLIPLMLAAATGAVLTRWVYGNEVAFQGMTLQIESLLEIPLALGCALLAGTMLLILNLKIVATSACVGSGLPGGVIGPTLLIGAMAGGLIGTLAMALLPDSGTDIRLYVLLGMAGMMSATLRAPMAALMSLLELSFNPGVIFPGMLVVVSANLVAGRLFRQPGIFQMLLATRGLMLSR